MLSENALLVSKLEAGSQPPVPAALGAGARRPGRGPCPNGAAGASLSRWLTIPGCASDASAGQQHQAQLPQHVPALTGTAVGSGACNKQADGKLRRLSRTHQSTPTPLLSVHRVGRRAYCEIACGAWRHSAQPPTHIRCSFGLLGAPFHNQASVLGSAERQGVQLGVGFPLFWLFSAFSNWVFCKMCYEEQKLRIPAPSCTPPCVACQLGSSLTG